MPLTVPNAFQMLAHSTSINFYEADTIIILCLQTGKVKA